MKVVSLTEFRNHAAELIAEVEHGKTVLVTRHGKTVAATCPVEAESPSWKGPALRLALKGAGIGSAILEERGYAAVS